MLEKAAIDEPLLYESWGKNQTYIIAFTPHEVVDVTDRYTRQVPQLHTGSHALEVPSIADEEKIKQ